MNSFEFKAYVVTYEDDGEIVTIGFAENAKNPNNYLIIEYSYEYDDQERSLGLDKLYLELNDQSRSTYGGLQHVSLNPKKLVFSFDPDALGKLKIEGQLSIELMDSLSQDQLDKIREVLVKEGVKVV